MRWLEFPYDEDCAALSARVFRECVGGYRKSNPKSQLAAYDAAVESASAAYREKMPAHIDALPDMEQIPKQDRDGLCTVYKEKFAKQGSPGRRYYDRLMAAVQNGICPICELRHVSCLDHYLPKAKYPLLSVAPINLIPMCSSCNGLDGKASYCGSVHEEMPIHLFLDEKPTRVWLHATFSRLPDVRIIYSCCYPDDLLMQERLALHLRLYKLDVSYELQATALMQSMLHRWMSVYVRLGREGLSSALEYELQSAEMASLNSWTSAMYRALVLQIDDLIAYLEQYSEAA